MSTDHGLHISANRFSYSFSSSPSAKSNPPTVIYFISGNPGLIGYYYTFLSLLSEYIKSQTSQNAQNISFLVSGHSLAGFGLPESNNAEKNGSQSHYRDLEEQICFAQKKLDDLIMDLNSNATPNVILIGHSVGSYIAMEILRRHRDRTRNEKSSVDFNINGGVMLFPTVVDIAKSPSGQKLTRILYFIPQLALMVGAFVRILTALIPHAILWRLVNFYMGSPPRGMVDTTTAFLKSRGGVQQALHMAADEMRIITSDKWSDDVWGMSASHDPISRLYFYFGRNDHWVAEQTRDEIVAIRGRGPGGPKMI
ncbi:hypothetical protein FE257_009045 [Aspergillus nanangensis]|uniref:Lipid droplet-associated hydrolase n=1 Tax=Aspergillus nanangensis TaxID=2582783 RepID=A0AAD4GYJ8_ASPNN|nr:hypothetical protein FE257_009045 [Aspergillus nanangensis]